MSEKTTYPLNNEYTHWHNVTSLRYQQFLQSLTALELDDAQRHLILFSNLLNTSIRFSDQRIEELLDETDESTQMVMADHLILTRTLALAERSLTELQQLEQVQPSSLRAQLVNRLDIFVRLNNILTRHHLRQIDSLFPLFEAKLSELEAVSLACNYTEAMQRAHPN